MTGKHLPEFVIGQKWAINFFVSAEEQAAFAKLSGDYNPIHLEPAAAEQAGFPRPIVYGALLISKLSSIIGMEIPGALGVWSGVQIDFRNPLLVGQGARMEVELVQISDATKSYVMKVSVRSDEKLIASGKALATLL